MKAVLLVLLIASAAYADVKSDVTSFYQGMFDAAGLGELTDIPSCVDDPTAVGIIDFYQGWAETISSLDDSSLFDVLGKTRKYTGGEGAEHVESVNDSVWDCIADSSDDATFKDKVGVTLSPNDLKAKIGFLGALTFSSDARTKYRDAFSDMADDFSSGDYHQAGFTYISFAKSLAE